VILLHVFYTQLPAGGIDIGAEFFPDGAIDAQSFVEFFAESAGGRTLGSARTVFL
jgi:hypothetical protein